MCILIGVGVLLWGVSLWKKEIRKGVGIFFILLYIAYTAYLLVR